MNQIRTNAEIEAQAELIKRFWLEEEANPDSDDEEYPEYDFEIMQKGQTASFYRDEIARAEEFKASGYTMTEPESMQLEHFIGFNAFQLLNLEACPDSDSDDMEEN
jgi:hypothetical protein